MGENAAWEWWMGVAEKSFKEPGKPYELGQILAETATDPGVFFSYGEVGRWLKCVLTEKLMAGTEAYLILKRTEGEHGVRAWAEIYRYYMEVSGMGINHKMAAMMQPGMQPGTQQQNPMAAMMHQTYLPIVPKGLLKGSCLSEASTHKSVSKLATKAITIAVIYT